MNEYSRISDKVIKARSVELIRKVAETRYGSPDFTRLTDSFRSLTFPKIPELNLNINPHQISSRIQELNEEASSFNNPQQSKLWRLFFKPKTTQPVDNAVLQRFYKTNYKFVLKMVDETTYAHFQLLAQRKEINSTMESISKLEFFFDCVKEELFKKEIQSQLTINELQEIISGKQNDLKEYSLIVEHAYLVNENLINIYDNLSKMLQEMRKKMKETLNYQTTVENKISSIENSFNFSEKKKA